jgi:hypothetical protein
MVDEAIAIFTNISGAGDRLARSHFRKYLILEDLGKNEAASDALSLAQKERHDLVGSEAESKNSMEAYDSLVSYYNK